MATKIKEPSSVAGSSWYPQFQETNATLNLPGNKFFGVTKRIAGLTAATILTKVTGIHAVYADVANGVIDRNRTWLTGDIFRQNAILDVASVPVSVTIANGQTITREYNNSGIPSDAFLGENTSAPNPPSADGLSVSRSLNAGKVTWTITNNTGSSRDVTGTFSVRVFRPVNDIANNVYIEVRKGTPFFSEYVENGMPINKMEEVYARIYYLMTQNEGVTSPVDTNIIADYFDKNNGFSTDVGILDESEARLKEYFSTEALARGSYFVGNGQFITSRYYTEQAYNYRNRMVGGYIDGIRKTYGGATLCELIYNVEKAFLAMNNRKVAVFGWGGYEGVDRAVESGGVYVRLPMKSPDGDFMALSGASTSYNLIKSQAFFSLLLGSVYVMWHDNVLIGTDIKCFEKSWLGNGNPQFNQWQPTGGGIVQYDPNNPAHPKPVCSANQSAWNVTDASYHNGAFAGSHIFSQIAGRVNTLKYANASYVENGVTKSAYSTGNAPVAGSLGNASVSRYLNSNYGGHSIVDTFINKKPILMYGTGPDGDVFIIQNVHADVLTPTTYTFNEGTPVTITHTGVELGVYIR